ncbi:unnamed protein product [Aphanomyces euteiches]|uniref:Uncharacterized protein n=1 Tax=Aphanomyces euteiches TaxID=100861 RepID=A0A6G0X1K5_9STRA|nr:hypothetical protein Ae201684_009273 [Aphanomyces euteiches]KAH9070038.1 hypothetical protein Ae201684P_002410 [Aphanomyces euteiches]KAH9145750.1 hypothetical protein AeRB84_010335 [Aphanomyces euteiches]
MSSSICHFNGCQNAVVPGTSKCIDHKRKGQCNVHDCHNQVYQNGVCVKHGARNTPCSVDGCNRNVRVSGLCNYHATTLPSSKCIHHGCKAQARGSLTCRRHDPERIHPPSPLKLRRRHASAAAKRDCSRTEATAKYSNIVVVDDLCPNAVLDNCPLPPSFFDDYNDILADVLWLCKPLNVFDDDTMKFETVML